MSKIMDVLDLIENIGKHRSRIETCEACGDETIVTYSEVFDARVCQGCVEADDDAKEEY